MCFFECKTRADPPITNMYAVSYDAGGLRP